MTNTKTTLCTLSLCLLASAPASAFAQTDTTGAGNSLRIATGKQGKGYAKLFADIRAVCGAQIPMTEIETEGGLQNLTTLAANRADLGLAQIDTLQDLKGSDKAIAGLLAVMSLNTNLLHLLAPMDAFTYDGPKRTWPLRPEKISVVVAKLSDLKGLPVAVVGSARAMGRALDRRHALSLQFIDVETDEQALAKVKSGEVAAMFSTSGWPSGPIQKLRRDSALRLLPYDLAVQAPYQLVRKNYDNLNSFNHPFLAVPNLLLSRPFSTSGAKGKAVVALQDCIQKNLVNLQEGNHEPAWGEVTDLSDTFGWPGMGNAARR
jgi:TRAP-type uncharacterized transport system substrate-binding protein